MSSSHDEILMIDELRIVVNKWITEFAPTATVISKYDATRPAYIRDNIPIFSITKYPDATINDPSTGEKIVICENNEINSKFRLSGSYRHRFNDDTPIRVAVKDTWESQGFRGTRLEKASITINYVQLNGEIINRRIKLDVTPGTNKVVVPHDLKQKFLEKYDTISVYQDLDIASVLPDAIKRIARELDREVAVTGARKANKIIRKLSCKADLSWDGSSLTFRAPAELTGAERIEYFTRMIETIAGDEFLLAKMQ